LSKHPLHRENEKTGGGFRIYSSAHDTNSLFIPTVIGNMLNVEQAITALELGRLTYVFTFSSYCFGVRARVWYGTRTQTGSWFNWKGKALEPY